MSRRSLAAPAAARIELRRARHGVVSPASSPIEERNAPTSLRPASRDALVRIAGAPPLEVFDG